MEKVGRVEASKKYFAAFKAYADKDHSVYQGLSLSTYYAHHGELNLAMKHLKTFSRQKNYQFWVLLFLRDEPLLERLKGHPEFDTVMARIDETFWAQHKQTRAMLEAEGLL